MLTDNQKKFVEDIIASKIVSVEEIKAWAADAEGFDDVESFANNLIRSGRLTQWQARYLMGGRTRLRFGNYVLNQRLGRDELGDSFLGKHDKLDRNVRLFFLATDHSKTLARNEQLIRELASTADVDHPNLEQVHLIDQDSGRYMFVTQQLDGNKLSDPGLLTRLTTNQIPAILKQIVAGLAAAHDVGLCHGMLSDENIYVTENNDVKLEGFIRSNLRCNLIDKKTPTRTHDIELMKQLARRLTKRFDSNEARRIVADLDNVLRDNTDLTAITGMNNQAKPSLPDVNMSNDSTPEHKTAPQTKPAASNKQTAESAASPNSKSKLLRNLLWSSAGILAVVSLIVFGPKLLSTTSGNTQAKKDSTSTPIELPTLPAELKAPSKSVDDASDAVSGLPGGNEVDAAVANVEVGETVGINFESGDGDVPMDDVPTDNPDIDLDSDLESMPDLDTQIESETESSSSSSFLDKFKATSDENGVGASKESSPVIIEKPKDGKSGAVSDHTAPISSAPTSFPSATDLPPTTITDGLGLVNFGRETVVALGLELLSDENVAARSKIKFELSGERDRSWDVSMTNSQSKTRIGRFVWTDNQLNFHWHPEASGISDANYLRNCILKINDGTGTKSLPLRKPVIIPGFVLQRDNPKLKVEIPDLEFLPRGAIAEMHELDGEKYGQIYLGDEAEDQSFSRKQPLTLMFSEIPEYQMVMLTLKAEIKNKSKLEALLQVRLSAEQKPRLANDKTMDSAKQFLEQYIVDVTNNYETLKKMKIDQLRKQLNMTKEQLPFEDKKAREKQLKDEIEIAKKRAEVFRETQSKLEVFFSRPIPVSIYYQLGNQRVVLATTVGS